MKQRDEWFRVTLTSLGDAVMTTDPEGTVTFLNPVAEELIGLGIATVKGRPIGEVFQIFNESTHQPVENPIKEVLNSGKVVSLANHTVLKRTDGEMVPIEDSAAPIRDSCDQIIGAVLVFRDATLERRARDILRNSEKFAAAARIAASIAHEIHNPLDSVVNLLYLLKHDPSPEERAEFIDMAQGELARVTEISRAMLCMHRESRTPVLLDLSSVLRSVMVLMERSMTEAGITVRTKLASNAVLSGYPAELRQVFSNILDNAVEASSPGGRIEVSVLSTGPRRARGKAAATLGGVVVTIADHGHGIPAKLLMDLFQPFFTTKGERGTGLGLWISRSVVEKHGGTITVESRTSPEDHGTTFTIFLPHSDAVQEAASTVDNSDKHKSEAEPHPEPKAAAAA
jgi:PAS domain S-box-containing protein